MRKTALVVLLALGACAQPVVPGQRAQHCVNAVAETPDVPPPAYVRLTPSQWPDSYGEGYVWYEAADTTVYYRGDRFTAGQAAAEATKHALAQSGRAPEPALLARAEQRCRGNIPAITDLLATGGFDQLVAEGSSTTYGLAQGRDLGR